MKYHKIIENTLLILVLCLVVLTSCEQQLTKNIVNLKFSTDTIETKNSDSLRVGTVYGSTSYFVFRDEPLGYQYEMAQNFGKFAGKPVKIIIAKSEYELLNLLEKKEIDIAAYDFFESLELKSKYRFVFTQNDNELVLVQNIGVRNVSQVIELSGKSVHVVKNSIYHKTIEKLNEETGGNIIITAVNDTLNTDALLQMLADKKIEYTITSSKSAKLYKRHYKLMDMNVPLSFKRNTGWLLQKNDSTLAKQIDEWWNLPQTRKTESVLYVKYWERSPYFASRKLVIGKGAISPWDEYFRKYAPEINWDWRLLAAVAFNESGFDPDEVSWAGASGIMQLMPRTAANFGLNRSNILDPEKNIEAGVQYIKSLNLAFRKIADREERIKFILASYNSGPAHIFDAMKLAEKYGKNPHIWFDNVDIYLLKKSEPEFYNDPVVKQGKFRGRETVAYVINTLETYEKYLKKNL